MSSRVCPALLVSAGGALTSGGNPSAAGATESQTKNKKCGICAFFKRTWEAVKSADGCCCRGNKVTLFQPKTDPVDPLSPLEDPAEGAHQQASPAAGGMENNPTEKQRKNKKSGVCAFFKRSWQAVKCVDRCHHRENKVRPFQPEADAADLQQASSLEARAFPDLDPADPEPAKEKQPKIKKKGIFAFVKRTLRAVKCATKQNHEEPVAPQPNTDSGPSEAAEQKPCSPACVSADLQSPGQSDPSQVSFASLYEVRTKISSGGFGTVFRGIHRSDGQEVAIKFIPKRSTDQYIRRAGYPKPLLMEVALNLLLKTAPISPNIVYMLEWFEEEDQHILIMEYPQPCHNIKTLLRYNRHKLDETSARSLMLQAVLAAKHCIDQGVFHRDIKLNNLLLNTRTMEVKLIDFGCGDLVKTSGYQHEFRGRYRPPEYYTKHQYHAGPTTVWTLGLALFRMVTGHHAFQTEKDILAGNLTFDSSLSRECQDVISQCLIRDPDDRATLQQLLDHKWFKQEDDPAVDEESDSSNELQ